MSDDSEVGGSEIGVGKRIARWDSVVCGSETGVWMWETDR